MMEKDSVEIEEELVSQNGNSPASTDALQTLLDWDGSLHITDKVRIDRLGINVIIRAASIEEMEKYNKAAEIVSRTRGGVIDRQTDNVKLGRLLVFNCVENPNLKDIRLQEKHNRPGGKERAEILIVNSLFLPGEIVKIQDEILVLSGFEGGAYMSENEDENLS